MTKQQTIDQIKNSLPGFYSAEQVIEMLTKIEEPAQLTLLKDEFMDEFHSMLENKLDRYGMDFVDSDSAEFGLRGNEIVLESVCLNAVDIADKATEILHVMLEKGREQK